MYKRLRTYSEKDRAIFHMPGTKGGKALPPKEVRDVMCLDLTELAGTDNLFAPRSIIADMETHISGIYHSNHSFLMTGGSTVGILAALSYLCPQGGTLITDRNMHVSVLNAMILLDIQPIFLHPRYDTQFGVTTRIGMADLLETLNKHPDAKGLFLTSPNYYGITQKIDGPLIEKLHNKGMYLVADEAHGAHFPFSPLLPNSMLDMGADIVIQSAHKTLPAPTGAAFLHISNRIDGLRIKDHLRLYHTTSPSYITMAYTDLALQLMQKEGQQVFENLQTMMTDFPLAVMQNDDFSRLVLHVPPEMGTGQELSAFLDTQYDVTVEMADLQNIVCICGKGNTKRDFDRLRDGISRYIQLAHKPRKNIGTPPPQGKMAMRPRQAFLEEKTETTIQNATGHICGEMIVPYPPGIPIIIPGEVITTEMIDYLHQFHQKDTIQTLPKHKK